MEFEDKSRDIYEEYYAFLDQKDNFTITAQVHFLKYLIYRDKNFFEPYVLLSEIYYRQDNIPRGYRLLSIAYKRMLRNVFKSKKLPQTMSWYVINNRHIFRLIFNYADILWFLGDKPQAEKLFRKLVGMHPSDNIGARYSILAIHEGFNESNHLWTEVNDVEDWFQETLPKYFNIRGFKYLKKYYRNPKNSEQY